jgi:hypothetical protein
MVKIKLDFCIKIVIIFSSYFLDRGMFTEMNLFFDDPQFAEVKRRVFSQLAQWLGLEIDSDKN